MEKSCLEYENELKKKEYLFNQIVDNLGSLNKAVDNYQELTNERIRYDLKDGKLSCEAYPDDWAETRKILDNWRESLCKRDKI